MGSDLAAVLDGGLTVLSEPQLRMLLHWPWVLRELQQRVLLEGGSYWRELAARRPFAEVRTQIWSRLEPQLKLTGSHARQSVGEDQTHALASVATVGGTPSISTARSKEPLPVTSTTTPSRVSTQQTKPASARTWARTLVVTMSARAGMSSLRMISPYV